MSLAAKITALLDSFTVEQIRGMSPVARQQLANACERVLRHIAIASGPRGVLGRLKDGERSP